MVSMLSLSGLLKHLFGMVVHILSFGSSVLGSTTAVFLDHVDFLFIPQLQEIIPVFPVALQSGHCCLEVFSQSSKISVFVHVGDQILRFFAGLVDLLRLSQVLNE